MSTSFEVFTWLSFVELVAYIAGLVGIVLVTGGVLTPVYFGVEGVFVVSFTLLFWPSDLMSFVDIVVGVAGVAVVDIVVVMAVTSVVATVVVGGSLVVTL